MSRDDRSRFGCSFLGSPRSIFRIGPGGRLLSLLLPAALLTACSEYSITTTVNADGSGLRVERIEAQPNSDVKLSVEDFPALMNTTEGDGWSHAEELDDDGEVVHIFRRSTPIRDLPDWSGLNKSVRIDGAAGDAAQRAQGYVKMDEVSFYNQLHLSMASDSEGSTSFTYRETFTWDRAVDALVEFLMSELDRELETRYPNLREEERGQIIGFARARFWVAVEDGLLKDDADSNKLLGEVVLRTTEQGIKVIRMRYPEADQEGLEETLAQTIVHSDDRLIQFLEEDLPGLNLAFNSEITYRLTLPGRVTRSNAHDRENGTLVWEFSPADALTGPIEIYAESRVGGGGTQGEG